MEERRHAAILRASLTIRQAEGRRRRAFTRCLRRDGSGLENRFERLQARRAGEVGVEPGLPSLGDVLGRGVPGEGPRALSLVAEGPSAACARPHSRSIPGRPMSQRIRSGPSRRAFSMPSGPEAALSTAWPMSSSSRRRLSAASMLSSMMRIAPVVRRRGRWSSDGSTRPLGSSRETDDEVAPRAQARRYQALTLAPVQLHQPFDNRESEARVRRDCARELRSACANGSNNLRQHAPARSRCRCRRLPAPRGPRIQVLFNRERHRPPAA